MRVVYSPDIFRLQRVGGVSRYYVELQRGLLARGVDAEIWAGLHDNALLRGVARVRGVDAGALRPAPARRALARGVDWALEAVWARRVDDATIYHKTYFSPGVRPAGPLVVTVYDMIHERYPTQAGSRDRSAELKRRWCERADLVFAISATTRRDLLERIPLDPAKVLVTHLGVRAVDPDRAASTPTRPYLLYVGDRRAPYKNFRAVVAALPLLDEDLGLVCFGGGSPSDAERRALADAGLAGRVSFTAGDDHVLAAFLRHAAALVYPSRYEGFGLPPLEAMAQGCPVVCADTPALVEVSGPGAELFDPDDAEALADAVQRVLEDEALRQRLIAAGHARAGQLTWDDTVERTLAGYRSLHPTSEVAPWHG